VQAQDEDALEAQVRIVDIKAPMTNGEALQGQAQAEAALETEATIVDIKAILEGTDEKSSEINGAKRVLKRVIVNKDPEISLIPDFVDDAEIEHLISLAGDLWEPSVVGSGVYKTNDESKDLSNKSSQNRTSFSCSLRSAHTASVKAVEERLSFAAGMSVDYLERLNMVRYMPGQFFNKHHDGRFRPKTLFLYLNDLPDGDGGETFFPRLGLKFTPRKGCLIMWSNTESENVEDWRMVHQGLPPRTMMKYGVNCFFNAKPVRQWEEPDSEEEPERAQQYRTVDGAELQKEAPHRKFCSGDQPWGAYQVGTGSPSITVIPQLISQEEAEIFCNYAKGLTAEIGEIVANIQARLAAVAGLPETHIADLNTTSIEEGMLSKPQVMADLKRPEMQPLKAVFIFLNEVPNRGELRFPHLGLQVVPHAGCAVIWDVASSDGQMIERAVHLSRPPRSGIVGSGADKGAVEAFPRYAATCVFHSTPVR